MPRLYGRTLKPSQRTSFETELTLLLAVIRVPLLVPQAKGSVTKTLGICGPSSKNTSQQYDLLDASLKTSKDTSASDSEKSLATWKALVTERRGEYLVREKWAHRTRESESTSWPTVRVSSANGASQKEIAEGNPKRRLQTEVRLEKWATPRVADSAGGPRTLNERGQRVSVSDTTKTYGANLSDQVRHWPTPSARDHKGGSGTVVEEGDKFYRVSNTTQTRFGARLGAAVEHLHKKDWPTPIASEARLGYKDRSDPTKKGTQESLTTVIVNKAGGRSKCSGHLNPDWVEQLMGVPVGWTSLTGTNTQWTNRWADGSWEEGIPRVVESVADRVDRIRMLGNGVVPATAAKAWQVLTQRFCNGGVTCA